jgi:hypothetical protein
MFPALALAFLTHPLGIAAAIAALALALPLLGMCPSPATVYPGVLSQDAINKLLGGTPLPLAASGAIDPHTAARYIITKAGLAAMTLAAPTAGADDGLAIEILSSTAFAHTITATGLLIDGAGHVNTATFPAAGGGTLDLMAFNGKWYVQNSQNITFA